LLQPVPAQSMDTVNFIKGQCYGQSVTQPAGTRKAVNMGRSKSHIKITETPYTTVRALIGMQDT